MTAFYAINLHHVSPPYQCLNHVIKQMSKTATEFVINSRIDYDFTNKRTEKKIRSGLGNVLTEDKILERSKPLLMFIIEHLTTV